MAIKLPKGLKGFHYPQVTPITFDRFDIDLAIPMLFFRVVTGGKDRGRQPSQAFKLDQVIRELQTHPDVKGFEGDDGNRLLGRVVRTAIVQTGHKGKQRQAQTEQLMGITTPTLLAFKAGYPTQTSLLDNVDRFLYQILVDELGGPGALHDFFMDTFGAGVEVWDRGMPNGQYVESSGSVDTLTRLGIAFLDILDPVGVNNRPPSAISWDSLPGFTKKMGGDIVGFLLAYRRLMPPEAMMLQTRGLLNLELFFYTLKLVYAIDELVREPESLPPAMTEGDETANSPEVYLDFAGPRQPLSREMSNWSVRRDMDTFQRFIRAKIELRQLHAFAAQLQNDPDVGARAKQALNQGSAPKLLQDLLRLRTDDSIRSDIEASARALLTTISAEAESEGVESEELNRLTRAETSSLQRLVSVLVHAQRPIHANVMKWYSGVGGVTKPYGIVDGQRTKNSWRYAPTNDLLAILVQLAQAHAGRDQNKPVAIKLSDFIDYLATHFGILIDRPPTPFVGPEYLAAARANLESMLDRLREMGVFKDLSDDFTVQLLDPVYTSEEVA